MARSSTPNDTPCAAISARRARARRIGGPAEDLTGLPGDLVHGGRERTPRALARLGSPRPVDHSVRARRTVFTFGPEAPIVARGRAAG